MLRSCRVLFMVQGQAGGERTATRRHRRAREGLVFTCLTCTHCFLGRLTISVQRE